MTHGARLLLLAGLALLAGCSNTGVVIANLEALCHKPPLATISVSKTDRISEGTSTEIEAHNRALPKVCPDDVAVPERKAARS